VILLPVFPDVAPDDGSPESPEVDAEEPLFLFLVRTTGTVTPIAITARTDKETMIMFLLLRDVGALELEVKERLKLVNEGITGIIGVSFLYCQSKRGVGELDSTLTNVRMNLPCHCARQRNSDRSATDLAQVDGQPGQKAPGLCCSFRARPDHEWKPCYSGAWWASRGWWSKQGHVI
jgi:hypothetical protein